ncbi:MULTISPECIES: tRNA dihydrouridine synthase DusB [unclassified Guyparkeria]|uniref:tRNA dihydrouridine synthase DusB n=1 Tax=unclassified Guyparkeria TaxID=2626246 RepID=UPI000A63635A|nr:MULTISPECIES: tRNA dihydrouridine synthase DusB [unclassified Guyparkeria]
MATSKPATGSRLQPIELIGRDERVRVDFPLALAPMAGISDRPFRQLCRDQGAGLVINEMVSSKPELRNTRKSEQRRLRRDDPEPRAVQLLGNDPADLAQAARQAHADGAQIIDLNFGCPAKKVCRKAAGSALMAEPDTVARLLEAAVEAVPCPVTLKMRTGPDDSHRNAPEIARIAEDAGIAMLSIHGRSREQKYAGSAEYETIARVVGERGIPVLANGDIDSVDRAFTVLEATQAAGLMVGRAAFGRPWLFAQLRAALEGRPVPAEPDPREIMGFVREQFENIYSHYGNMMGVRIARKHWGWYSSRLPIEVGMRKEFNRLETIESQRDWLDRREADLQGLSQRHPEPTDQR